PELLASVLPIEGEPDAGGGGRARPRARRALLVTQDPVVQAGHVGPVADALRVLDLEVAEARVPDGEAAKSPAILAALWERAAEIPLSRQDVIVAVGGGVVGDLAGFLAATYARGLDLVQVPTTVLAQVDAAIGGKTGINLPAGKNLVGAFHQPRAVVCDVATLRTLPERVRREGFGEIVKYGLIRDPDVLEVLEADPSVAAWGATQRLRELVERSVAVKAIVVAADEREAGERAYLNLGHTVGHAVEALTGYSQVLHGEAVAIGIVASLRIGVAMGRTPPALAARGEAVLAALGLPVRLPPLDRGAVWDAMARDKKAEPGRIRFVLLDDVARPVLAVPPREVVDAVLDALTDTER
ncbi:MAG: 3-dehydroquinate synthase, partial [Nitriliruptoraceae bacterium]